ncbi:hypothetical protein F2P56_016010, partial [Juglans regia]
KCRLLSLQFSSNLMKRTIPICSFNLAAAKAPPFLLSYIAISPKKPVRLSVHSLADEPARKSPPEFPKVPNHQPSVPPEVPPVPTTPDIDPGSIPAEVNTNPPPYSPPGTKPGPEFPRTSIPPHPDPGPELPKPTIPPRPDPDIQLPKPDVVPPYPPDYVPPNPPGPDIVPPPLPTPPPGISPPTGPYILEEVLRRGVGFWSCFEFELADVGRWWR